MSRYSRGYAIKITNAHRYDGEYGTYASLKEAVKAARNEFRPHLPDSADVRVVRFSADGERVFTVAHVPRTGRASRDARGRSYGGTLRGSGGVDYCPCPHQHLPMATYDPEADQVRKRYGRQPRAVQEKISKKIRVLVREGYPPKQAAAIAYKMVLGPARKKTRAKSRKKSRGSVRRRRPKGR